MSLLTDVIGYGTHAARPAAGSAGRLYYETDTAALFRDSGTAWVALPLGSGTPAVIKLDEIIVPVGGQSTIHFASVPSGYAYLDLHILGISDGLTSGSFISVQFNGDSTPANYKSSLGVFEDFVSGQTVATYPLNTSHPGAFVGWLGGTDQTNTLDPNSIRLYMPDYDQTGKHKIVQQRGMSLGPNDYEGAIGTSWWLATAAITDILLTMNTNKFAEGSKARLYGVV